MTVAELKKEIDYVIDQIEKRGLDSDKIVVSMQIDNTNSCGVSSAYITHEVNIILDNNGIAPECVIYGWPGESEGE